MKEAALALAIITSLMTGAPARTQSPGTADWQEPVSARSRDGVLDLTLDARKSTVTMGGAEVESNAYNGRYIGPTMVVRPGDTLRINLVNGTTEDTNLHFHGAHVTPKGNSDNVFLRARPGTSLQYEVRLPATHPTGLYWYHPHWHGHTEDQILDGLAGAIVIRGALDELPGITGLTERLLVLTTRNGADPHHPVRLVNGRRQPALDIRPGELQRWRVLNASADDFYNFSIPGMRFHLIARDGNTLAAPLEAAEELMAPGDRIEILVRGPAAGAHDVVSLPFNEGFAHYVRDTFMTLRSSGPAVTGHDVPERLLPFEDLRSAKVDNTRTVRFTIGGTDENPTFMMNGRTFDSSRVDHAPVLGTTEDWILENPSNEWHPFHIHVNPFQVIDVNGKAVDRGGYDDTIGIPAGGSIRIRTRYTDFDGKFVTHCHILFHEDHGMMQVVRIIDPSNPDASRANSPDDHHHPAASNPKGNAHRGRRVHKQ